MIGVPARMETGNEVIQGLWVGSRFSTMERLCIASFLKNGHRFRLFVYHPVEGVPEGTEFRDANEILPAASVFQYSNGSYAGFSNFFRYKLLLEKGGWWVDLDTICLRPFCFTDEHVVGSHMQASGAIIPCGGMLKAPAGSPFCEYAWRICQTKDPRCLQWGETGPLLIAEAVKSLKFERYVASVDTFCPLHGHVWEEIFDPGATHVFGEKTYAVHLWNELWRRESLDKDVPYRAGCLYEKLKTRYL